MTQAKIIQIIECLRARIRSMEYYLQGGHSDAGWRDYSKDEIKGKIEEAKNALDMLTDME